MTLRGTVRTLVAVAWIAGLCLLAAACGARKAPVTAAAPPRAAAAAPPPAAHPPAPPAASPAGAAPAGAAPAGPAPAAAARPPAPAPLVGHVTRAAVEGYETWRTLRAQDYTPDPAAVQTIAERGRDIEVVLILATWCPDSKREVPRFFKILDQAGIGLDRVTMVAVDRSKKDAEGLTVTHAVLRVPTFVFLRNGQEVGRVTERAVTTLEQDIAAILTK
jgi:thiol-disulfide isomerase/thioredoxin